MMLGHVQQRLHVQWQRTRVGAGRQAAELGTQKNLSRGAEVKEVTQAEADAANEINTQQGKDQ